MSLNLLDLVKDQVTGHLAKQASGFLGESESGVAKALGGIMPSLMGGMLNKVGSDEGANGIMDIIGKLDTGSLGNIAGLFGGGPSAVNGLMNQGGGIVDMLLGNKASGIVDFIANMAGLKSSSSSSLLKMAAPFLMSIIGKQVAGKGVGFLKDLVMGQKSNISSAMPAGLGSVLGFADMLGGTGDSIKSAVTGAANTMKSVPTPPAPSGGGMGWLKWLLPLLLVAGIYMFTKNGCNKKAAETMDEVAAPVVAEVDSVAIKAAAALEAVKGLFSNIDTAAQSAFSKLTIEAGSAPEQIKNYIDGGFSGDPMFLIKNVNFASGSAELSKEAQAEVDNLAALLKVYPGVKIDINGHTDNVGNPESNMKLSQARAASVMARLVGKGSIAADRLKALGFGDTQPAADNATAEGKAKNRRIELKVVQ
jgi:OmpA-OmpF porin, OOP family